MNALIHLSKTEGERAGSGEPHLAGAGSIDCLMRDVNDCLRVRMLEF